MTSSRNTFVRWAVDITQWKPSIHDISFIASCVQPEESDRLMKFHFREDFDASLLGRLLIRKFVREFTGIPYENIQLTRDSKGKPILKNHLGNQHIDFNVSHHGSFSILTGISQTKSATLDENVRIGVDVMKIEYNKGTPLNQFFRLMNRNFSNSEWKFIKTGQADIEQLKAFMRNWCLKESYVKNIGVGITVDLQNIIFNINTKDLTTNSVVTDTKLTVDNIPVSNWIFEEHLLDERHCAAVSIRNCPNDYEPKKFDFITTNDLLKNVVSIHEINEFYGQKVICKEFKNRNK